jgi:hypothetical protein
MRDIVLSVRDFRHLVSFVQDDELLWKLLKSSQLHITGSRFG